MSAPAWCRAGELVWNDAANFATNHRSATDHSSWACGEPGEGYPAPPHTSPSDWLATEKARLRLAVDSDISVHCQIMMDHCPTQSSLPSSLGSSCLRSPATRLSPPPAPSSANFVPENTETRHENRNVALFSVTNISGMIFGVFRVSATADSSKAS